MDAVPDAIDALRLPITRAQYEEMVRAGVFDGLRAELLYGVIVRMSPHGPPHDSTLTRLSSLLVRSVGATVTVRTQCAFAASDGSEPEPDVAVVPSGDYDSAHPSQALLIVEVAVSSLEVDRGIKARLYAESGVPEYWVVDVMSATVEVHTQPVAGRYPRVTPFRRGDTIRTASLPDLALGVDDFVR